MVWNLGFATGKVCDPEVSCPTSLSLKRDIHAKEEDSVRLVLDAQPQAAQKRLALAIPAQEGKREVA